jgi:hypothetical protein
MAPTFMVRKTSAKPTIPAGRYRIKLDGLDTATFPDKQTGEDVTKLKLSFAVTSGKFAGTKVSDLFTDLVSPGSKLGNLLEAFSGGGELPDDDSDEINLADFVGSEASVRIDVKPSGYSGIVSGSAEPVEDAAAPF